VIILPEPSTASIEIVKPVPIPDEVVENGPPTTYVKPEFVILRLTVDVGVLLLVTYAIVPFIVIEYG
jgi:hypothetical protein